MRSTSRDVGVSRSTLRGWVRSKDSLMQVMNRRNRVYRTTTKKSAYQLLEEKLNQHIVRCREEGANMSRRYIIMKARKYAKKLGCSNFAGTCGWLSRFLMRYKYVLRRITSTGRCLPDNVYSITQNHLNYCKKLSTKYSQSEILNMDETNIQVDHPSEYIFSCLIVIV